MTQTVDILVIGGGIAGMGAAARMAEGGAEVILLEREDAPGYHATGRSAAVFIRNYGNATLRALNAASAPEFLEPDGVFDGALLKPRGEMTVASEEELPALEAYLEGSSGLEEITPEEAVAHVPILRRDRIARVTYEADAQDIDIDRLMQGFARILRGHGGRIETGAEALSIARADGVWRVETPKGVYAAPVLVNAAGAWADMVAQLAGARPRGLTPMRRSAAILPAPEGHDPRDWPLVVSAAETWYMKPDAGRLMVSPADEDPVEPHDAWPDDMVLAEGLHRFEQATTVTVTRVERSWAGLRTFAPDRSPVLGFDARAEGFFWLAGQGGYGVQTAPAMARLAAALVAGRAPDPPEAVVEALSPQRVGLGKRSD